MNRIFCLIILSFFISYTSFAGNAAVEDSLGVERIGGKTYILHKIEAKETFYSISRRYSVSIDEIVKNNEETKDGLKIDQVIRIPLQAPTNENRMTADVRETSTKVLPGSVLHEVRPSETLFSLSKLYNVKLEDIKRWNNLSGNELNIGQELIIKTDEASPNPGSISGSGNNSSVSTDLDKKTSPNETPDARVVHTVEPTQTLFSISKMYNVSVDDIKKWNEMETSEISIGQKLVVKRRSEQEVIAEAKPEKKTDFTAGDKTLVKESFENYEASSQRTSKAESEKAEKSKPVQVTTNTTSGNKIVELGFAEVIEGTDDTKKFRALHKTAPVGTIIQVKNEMNNLSVFVRVLGTLPSTGTNDKVLIKITKAAYDRLGAIDPRFPVEISYVP